MEWSIEHARRENYSLILEGVFRDPEMPHARAKAFASSHTVEVVGLAVHEEVSRLDAEYRFLEGGRWTPPELHDAQPLLQALVEEPPQNLPLRLQTEQEAAPAALARRPAATPAR